MKLWLLRPKDDHENWLPWYDKAFGFIVRAETEADARSWPGLSRAAGDEGEAAWRDPNMTTCTELTDAGEPGMVMVDFHAA